MGKRVTLKVKPGEAFTRLTGDAFFAGKRGDTLQVVVEGFNAAGTRNAERIAEAIRRAYETGKGKGNA